MFSDLSLTIPSPLQRWIDPVFEDSELEVWIKRDDLIHPVLCGNKWRKLKFNLLAARDSQCNTLLSFGGAYSNHLHALAASGALLGFKTVGVVRGELPSQLNPMLKFEKSCGMTLYPVTRKQYRDKNNEQFLQNLRLRFGDFYHLPEGGSNTLAVQGAGEIVDEINQQLPNDFSIIVSACGTAATFSGIVNKLKQHQCGIGIAVLNAHEYFKHQVKKLSNNPHENWLINSEFCFGGYAKTTEQLLGFMKEFEAATNIILDPVYTAKTFFAVKTLAKQKRFKNGERIVVIHTGGLYGRSGFSELLR